jgi:FAD:protein FMN transferase
LLTFVAAIGGLEAQQWQLVQRDVDLMGTHALVAAYASDRASGLAAVESAIDALERTEARLSTWRPDSAVSLLNRADINVAWHADADMCRLFAELHDWYEQTSGTFDPTVGALAAVWEMQTGGGVPPDAELQLARSVTGMKLLPLDRRSCTLTRTSDVVIDARAFGKGEALDEVGRALGGHAWIADLGGQVSVGGAPPDGKPWIVDVAHPLDRTRAVMQVQLRTGSLATSGGSEGDTFVGATRIGHVMDPRTGRPAAFNGSVVVWHERGLVADILSTALYVMGPEQGLQWAERRALAAAYVMPTNHGVATAATTRFADMKRGFVSGAADNGN